jgi:TPR repeat protein
MAEFGLGVMYHKGEGVPQDQTEVIKWYRRAAEQGFAIAQYNRGFMYGKGRGVPQNYVLAHMWYLLATTAGYGPADTARYRLSQRLTAAERAAAQALARQCHNTGYRECGEATQAEDLASLFEGEDDGQP